MDRRSYLSLLAGLGFSSTLFSAVLTSTFVAKLLTQGHVNILYLFGFAAATWGAGYLTYYALHAAARSEAPPKPEPVRRAPINSPKRQIMLLAQATKGRLSASEVAAATRLSLDESRYELESLVREGVAEIWLTDEGGFVYVFPELFAGFKDNAKNPLSD